MTDVLSTIFVINKENHTILPLRAAECRVYDASGAEAVQAIKPNPNPTLDKLRGPGVEEVQAARCYDLTNPARLRALADYIERERW